jgi:UDP-N-acetylglucosamine--N-acetylmuramyl-(pentapeptide) pyrophosphoryl-undecaprenol N-acetylglucosamine transferase
MSHQSNSDAGSPRVLVAGGGTGGHLFPGIAIAQEFKRRFPESEIWFVGTSRGLENRVVPAEGFVLQTITVSGLKGVSGFRKLKGILNLPLSIWESYQIIRRLRPRLVVGVGGYSSGPPVLVASLLGIPVLLQEQNAFPGMTNRILSRFADKVAVSFREGERYFGKKAILTGNPVRAGFRYLPTRHDPEQFTVFVFGGSQGAHAINTAMTDALRHLAAYLPRLFLVHQTGEKDFEFVSRAYQEHGVGSDVRAFFQDMPVQFARADLVVCRSGASTLAELTIAGKAALLIPFPLAADNHQQRNAEALVAVGAAELILQKDLTGESLARRIVYFAGNPATLQVMEKHSRELGRPDSTERIVDLMTELIHV